MKTLTWNPNPVSEKVTAYRVYHNGKLADTPARNRFVITKNHGTYTVTAVNAAGESKPSNSVTL